MRLVQGVSQHARASIAKPPPTRAGGIVHNGTKGRFYIWASFLKIGTSPHYQYARANSTRLLDGLPVNKQTPGSIAPS